MSEHTYLLLISIGPVQSFISEARRTQDLQVGSQILQRLSLAALRGAFADADSGYTVQPIYPVIESAHEQNAFNPRSMPNRFVVSITATSHKDCETVAQNAKSALDKAWEDIYTSTAKKFAELTPDGSNDANWQKMWSTQCKNWIEFYWSSYPVTTTYSTAFSELTHLLGSRKLLRDFDALSQPGEKCSLNGFLSALSNDDIASHDGVRSFWTHVRGELSKETAGYSVTTIRQGEQLCAINTLKRIYPYVESAQNSKDSIATFPSTSTFAAARFITDILTSFRSTDEENGSYHELTSTLLTYHNKLTNLSRNVAKHLNSESPVAKIKPIHEFDYPFFSMLKREPDIPSFFEFDTNFYRVEGIRDLALANCLNIDLNELSDSQRKRILGIFGDLRMSHSHLMDELRAFSIGQPGAYYAVIKLDGDEIGKFITSQRKLENHQDFSRKMHRFTDENDRVRRLVEETDTIDIIPGRLIYSGGDDILALTPAESALHIAEKIRRAFAAHFQAEGLHMSAGIVIAHYTHPLDNVLRAARAAEKAAKEVAHRNAFTIVVLRRSGTSNSVSLRWAYKSNDVTIDTVKLIQDVQVAFSTPYGLSRKIVQDALDIAMRLDQPSNRRSLLDAQVCEFERLFERRLGVKVTSSPGTEDQAENNDRQSQLQLGKRLSQLAQIVGKETRQSFDDPISGWQLLSNLLSITYFLTGDARPK